MNIALVLAGGTGSRVGADIPKQYIEVKGKPIISYCMDTLTAHDEVDAICIVADEMWHDYILDHISMKKFRGFSAPGRNRQLSIWQGLCEIKKYASNDALVMIHDSARPMLGNKLIDDCFIAVTGHDGAMPVLPMKDTVYLSQDGKKVSELLDRSSVFAGQAPEVFRLDKYYEANRKLLTEKILYINGSTEPAVLMGMDIAMVPGDERNFKITTKEDLSRFIEIMDNQSIY
ncbi:IspD/TarI family cytidylyltransferase [Lacrimispora sp.]|uniref:IspD/TarI family cytidylyltransferase n=1 Tax=Lacrimispora sp. TaxID=2719234 RepID=UPI002898DEF1|nr:IspD/TarI family cytidylyltransferase [Lacrimispora sp.]